MTDTHGYEPDSPSDPLPDLADYERRLNDAQAAVAEAASEYCWNLTPEGMEALRNAVAKWRSSVGLWKLASRRSSSLPPSDSIERVEWLLREVTDNGRWHLSGTDVDAIRALADRARKAERERDEAIKQRDYDYARFSDAKQAVIAADSERIAAEAEVKALREAAEWEAEHGGCFCRTCNAALAVSEPSDG